MKKSISLIIVFSGLLFFEVLAYAGTVVKVMSDQDKAILNLTSSELSKISQGADVSIKVNESKEQAEAVVQQISGSKVMVKVQFGIEILKTNQRVVISTTAGGPRSDTNAAAQANVKKDTNSAGIVGERTVIAFGGEPPHPYENECPHALGLSAAQLARVKGYGVVVKLGMTNFKGKSKSDNFDDSYKLTSQIPELTGMADTGSGFRFGVNVQIEEDKLKFSQSQAALDDVEMKYYDTAVALMVAYPFPQGVAIGLKLGMHDSKIKYESVNFSESYNVVVPSLIYYNELGEIGFYVTPTIHFVDKDTGLSITEEGETFVHGSYKLTPAADLIASVSYVRWSSIDDDAYKNSWRLKGGGEADVTPAVTAGVFGIYNPSYYDDSDAANPDTVVDYGFEADGRVKVAAVTTVGAQGTYTFGDQKAKGVKHDHIAWNLRLHVDHYF